MESLRFQPLAHGLSRMSLGVAVYLGGCNSSAPTNGLAVDGAAGTSDANEPAAEAGCGPVQQVSLAAATFGPVIDDMSMAQSATGGSWYSYSSRTLPNSEPVLFTTDAGVLDPSEGDSFPPNNGTGCVPPLSLDGGALGYREFRGHGIPSWGAGFGMDLISTTPDGGPVAINACDAGAIFDTDGGTGNVGIPVPYDAAGHGYTGFAFWAISLTSSDLKIEVHVDDEDTTPWGAGAFCDVCRSSGKCTGAQDAGTLDCPCSDNFYETVTFAHGRWTQFAIRWRNPQFTANHWSGEGPLVFDATHVYNIHFQDTISSGTAPPFDVAVANLQWLED
jgi:hypothetical protein